MTNFLTKSIALLFLGFCIISQSLHASDKLPLDAFAMQDMIRNVDVSPNGKKILMVRSLTKTGTYIVEIMDANNLKAKSKKLGGGKMEITSAFFLSDKKIIVNFRLEQKDGGKKVMRNLNAIINADGTGPWKQLRDDRALSIVSLLPQDPNHILVYGDSNGDRFGDIIKLNIKNYRETVKFYGTEKYNSGYVLDKDGDVRAATTYIRGKDSQIISVREKGSPTWKQVYEILPSKRESFSVVAVDTENQNMFYVAANNGQDKIGYYTLDAKTLKVSDRIFGLKSVDAGGLIRSSKKGSYLRVDGFTYTTNGTRRVWIDGNEEILHNQIKALFPKKRFTLTRSEDDNTMIIRTVSDRDSGSYYLLKDKKTLTYLASNYPLREEKKMARVKFYSYKARDGRKIRAYRTIPNSEGPYKTIIMPHGGPWVRDNGGHNEWAQLLANQGYMVIQPQFRGSRGFGLDHWIAGDREWGLKMQDDVDDAALHAVSKGWAQKDKLAIFGWSYGGYSAFVGAMRDNNIYKCSVAGAGVSRLSFALSNTYRSRIGRQYQRPTIAGIDPIDHVEKVNIPILVVHGTADYTVTVSNSRQFINQLKKYNKEHKYVEIDGLTHSPGIRYEHKKLFYTELLDWMNNRCFK